MPRSTFPPPPERVLDEEDDEEDEEEDEEDPLDEPDERLEPPLLDDEPPDEGLLIEPDPLLPRLDPEDDEPEPLRVEVPEFPRLPEELELPRVDELEPLLSLGVRRAPPIEPMTRRGVLSPVPRHESFVVPRVELELDAPVEVEGRLTGSSPPPRTTVVRGLDVVVLWVPLVDVPRTGRLLHSRTDVLALPPEPVRSTVVVSVPPPRVVGSRGASGS